MKPNEIKKALECCTCPVYDCDSCPLYGKLQEDCVCGNHLMKHALAYINQLETEVERLKGIINTDVLLVTTRIGKTEKLRKSVMLRAKEIKSEAIKEFDEILKEDCLSCPLEAGDVTMLVDVDSYNNLVKEMVGDEK